MPSSSESWVEGIGDITAEYEKYATYYLTAFKLPSNPRLLTIFTLTGAFGLPPDTPRISQHNLVIGNKDLICCYNILHPLYDIVNKKDLTERNSSLRTKCTSFRKNVKFTINYIYQLLEQFSNFCDSDSIAKLISNTDLLKLTDIDKFFQEKRKIELYLLYFNLKFRYKALQELSQNLPEITSIYLNELNQVINRINDFNKIDRTVENTIVNKMMVLYFIDIISGTHSFTRTTSACFTIINKMLTAEIQTINTFLNEINQNDDESQKRINHLLNVFYKNLIDETNERIPNLEREIREIDDRLTPEDEAMQLSDFKSLSSNAHNTTPFSESKYNSSKIHDKCSTIFKDINSVFKKDVKMMKVACNKLIDPKYCRDITAIKNHIFEYYSKQYPKIVEDTHAFEADTSDIVKSIFKEWLQYGTDYSFEDSMFERSIFYDHGFSITQKGLAGIGEGVTREMFTLLAEALKTQKIFIPIEEDSKRYSINYNYNIDIGSEEPITYGADKISHKILFWRFIGEFLQFCIINSIPLGFNLSNSLLYILLIRDEEQVNKSNLITYYLLDNYNSEIKFIIDALRNPEYIDEHFEKFNDYNKIVSKDKHITIKNFIEFLTMRAYYKLTQQTFSKKNNFSIKLDYFITGFKRLQYTKFERILNKNKVNVQTLDRLLSDTNITIPRLKEFVNQTYRNPSKQEVPLLQCDTGVEFIEIKDENGNEIKVVNDKYNPAHARIFQNFKRILSNGLKTFPIDKSDMSTKSRSSSSNSKKIKREPQYLKFMQKLFHFWCANSAINNSPPFPYKIEIINRPNSLPSSHTCFYTIDIPDDLTTYDSLYKKIVTAVMNVEEGLGLYGGK